MCQDDWEHERHVCGQFLHRQSLSGYNAGGNQTLGSVPLTLKTPAEVSVREQGLDHGHEQSAWLSLVNESSKGLEGLGCVPGKLG
jgi:hypothetical protein